MFTYYLAKAQQDQVLREVETGRLIRTIKRTERSVGKHKLSQAKGWVNRRLRTARA
jgi:hypothetical protein